MTPVEIALLIFATGWLLNWIATGVSTLNDLYWKNLNIAQGFLACAAFSWVPYLVFLAGIKHFIIWFIYERGDNQIPR